MSLRDGTIVGGRLYGSAATGASPQIDARWSHLALPWFPDPFQQFELRVYPIPLGDSIVALQPPPGADEIDDRLLVQMEDQAAGEGEFRKYVGDIALVWLEATEVVRSIRSAFKLETALTAQLDAIGGIVGLPRRGFSDDRYRTFLSIQILLLLASARVESKWTGTAQNLVTIARTFVGSSVGQIVLTNLPPYAYSISIPGIQIAELDLLSYFLCRATYAGVAGNVLYEFLNTLGIWGSETAGSTIIDVGNWGSETAGPAIANVGTWGTLVVIGGEKREC